MTHDVQAAVVMEKDGPFTIRDITLAPPRPGEVLVRNNSVGVCHTDIIMREQFFPVTFPAVFGHEGAGVVEAVGEGVRSVAPGDHVILGFNFCGRCENCLRGKPAYCLDYYDWNFSGRRVEDGTSAISLDDREIFGHFFGQSSFATHSVCPERSLVKVPQDVPLHLLGPLGCGIQTGAGAVLNSLEVEAGSSIVVFGTGGVGLSAIMAAVVAGATTVIGVDTRPERLELARELGATHTIDASREDVAARIASLTGHGAHYSVETTGSPQVLPLAVDCLRVTGVCGTIGASPMGTTAAITMNNLIFGRTIRGVCEGDSVPGVFIPRLIELFRQGRFPMDKMMRTYPFGDIEKACADANEGRTIKPVLVFD
jgi:aryl-alcohol dehydrogenase